MAEVIDPVLRDAGRRRHPVSGVPLRRVDAHRRRASKVLEFNCRLGDPETQVVLPRLDDDLLPLLADAARRRARRPAHLRWTDRAAVDVVLASAGYPGSGRRRARRSPGSTGSVSDVLVFHAGTRRRRGRIS